MMTGLKPVADEQLMEIGSLQKLRECLDEDEEDGHFKDLRTKVQLHFGAKKTKEKKSLGNAGGGGGGFSRKLVMRFVFASIPDIFQNFFRSIFQSYGVGEYLPG